MSVKFVNIQKSYQENILSNYVSVTVEEYIKLININKCSMQYTLYEVLEENRAIKIYMDVENIPYSETEKIYTIIDTFKNYCKEKYNLELTDYVLTQNNSSGTHPGLSYHVIFKYYNTYIYILRNLIENFIVENPELDKYIDCSVYSSLRLFKSVYQIGTTEVKDPNNYHNLILGTIEDSIIQNIKDTKEFFKEELSHKHIAVKLFDENELENTITDLINDDDILKRLSNKYGLEKMISKFKEFYKMDESIYNISL